VTSALLPRLAMQLSFQSNLGRFGCIIRTYATRGVPTCDVELSVSTDWQRIFPAKAFSLTYKAHEPMN
jgi:hypothetical protein